MISDQFDHFKVIGFRVSVGRLWRVSATLPYPDFIFTTRTLPGNYFKISGFRVVTIQAVFRPYWNVHPPAPPYLIQKLNLDLKPLLVHVIKSLLSDLLMEVQVVWESSKIALTLKIVLRLLEVVWEPILMSWHDYCFDKSWNCSQTFGSGTQKKYNNNDKKLHCFRHVD